jgi:hypothetical protein
MKSGKRRGFPGLRAFDYGAILGALGITVLSGALVYGGGGGEARVLIQGSGGRWVFPRDAAETLAVPGPLGETVVELRDGEARIRSSPCANQTCVSAGAVRSPRQWLVCLPNRVFVSVEGGREAGDGNEPDALAW